MKIQTACAHLLIVFLVSFIGCKPKLTADQQKQQEERWRKVDEFVAKSAARDDQRAAEKAQVQISEAARHHKAANANISYDASNVRIKNSDTNGWPELNVYINPGALGPLSGYGIRLPALQMGRSVTIPLEQFTKDNGERFNASAYRVVELWIGGGDYDYEKFGAN
jgi:hypothetical protein